jgi:hypothetical protein
MVKMTSQEHEYNAEFETGESVALYVNGNLFKEFSVPVDNYARVKFEYRQIYVEPEVPE